jgi:RHS repeat-associated protein
LNNRLQTVATNFVSITPQGNTTYGAKVYCYGPATAPVAAGFPGCDAVASVNSGNIWQIKDFLNGANTQSFGYDSLNRIASASGPGMSQQYAIDSFGNMSLMSGGSAITHFDAANRINDLPCASSVSAYDLAGNQVCDTDANGGVRQYQYDAESRVRQIASLGSSTPFATYNYDANGNRVRKSNADGTYTEYVNFGGQTIAERQSDGSWSDYIFAGGKRIARADNYDVRIHLSGVNCSNCGSNPNMFSGTNSLTAANGYTIRPGDVLRWRQYQDGSALGGLFTYFTDGSSANGVATDQDGQLINADTTKNTWHQRTVNLSAYAGKTITVIDPFDWTTAPAGAWDIYYGDISLTSQDGSVISLYNRSMMGLNLATNPTVSNASAVTEKVPAADVLTTTEFYVSDPLGSTQMLLSSGGWPLASSQYTPFGTEISTTSNPNHYKFTGLERDQESGLDHAVFRQYASNSGRWLSPDPYNGSMNLGNPQSFNRYAYVLNNPLRYRDPSGLRPCDGSPADTDGPCSAGGGFVGFFVDLADIIGSLFHHHPQLKASRTPRPNANIKATSSYGPIQAQADGTYTMAASYSVPSLSPDYYTLSGQFGYYSPALSYVPKTKNWFFNTQGAGPKGVGVAATAGWASGDPENYLGGRGIGACYFDIVGGCGGYSPGGGGWAVEAGFGTPSWGGSLGYAVDWNSYVQSVYESIPVNEGATIPIGSGLTMQDPMYP